MFVCFNTVLNTIVIFLSCLVTDVFVNIQRFPLEPQEIICQNKTLLNQSTYKIRNEEQIMKNVYYDTGEYRVCKYLQLSPNLKCRLFGQLVSLWSPLLHFLAFFHFFTLRLINPFSQLYVNFWPFCKGVQ
jgi:hypothetical protein